MSRTFKTLPGIFISERGMEKTCPYSVRPVLLIMALTCSIKLLSKLIKQFKIFSTLQSSTYPKAKKKKTAVVGCCYPSLFSTGENSNQVSEIQPQEDVYEVKYICM